MFGLISKKKLIKNALDIYREEETSEAYSHDNFMYRCGNANALNGLCSRVGINLTNHVKADRQSREANDA